MNKDSISNCYPPDFTYYARTRLDEKIGSIEKGKVQVLHGTIGTGKSSAALHFIDRSKEKFTVRWRVNCSEDEESIKSCLTELANKLGVVTDTSFSRLFQAIREKAAKEDIIFLLDEVQKKPCGLWRKELWQIKDSLYIMATTNNANLDLDSPCEHWIHVDKFDEALQFLKAEGQILENKDEDLNELCEYFSWNVLGLTAAKIYITKMKIPVKNYLRMQRKKTAATKVFKAEQDRTLYTAVRTCLEGIDKKDFPVAAAISLIAHENIAEFLLSELFSENDAPTRSACLNNLLQRSFLVKSLVHITTENNVRFLSFHKFTQSVIRHILDEDQSLRKNLIHKMAGVLVKYFRKDNRYKKGDFMQRIMVNHVEEFLKQCQDDQDDRISIASARLSELIAFTYTQGQEKLSEDSLRFHFQRSEDILHRLCGVTPDDFRVNSTCQETGNDLQSLGIRCSDIAVAQRLFEKLTKKSSELSNAIVQELALSRPLSSADLSLFPVEVRDDEELMEKVDSFEPLSDEDLELLIRKGVAYSADDYRELFLAELYSSIVYSFGRNYFYLNKQSIEDANLYINRLKLAYCISREISKRMKSGEAVMHEYLSQCNGLLYLLVNGEGTDENGCIMPKETKVHCQDLTNAIKHYQKLSQDKRQFFEMGVLKKKKDDRYSLLFCHHQIVHCYLQLISPKMTSSSEERDQYIRDGVKHREIFSELLNTKIPKDVNEQLTKPSKHFNLIERFDQATKCTEEEKGRSTVDVSDVSPSESENERTRDMETQTAVLTTALQGTVVDDPTTPAANGSNKISDRNSNTEEAPEGSPGTTLGVDLKNILTFEEHVISCFRKKVRKYEDNAERPAAQGSSLAFGITATVAGHTEPAAINVATAAGSNAGPVILGTAWIGKLVVEVRRREKCERDLKPDRGWTQSALEGIVLRTAKELSRIFEFQISMLKDSRSVKRMAKRAVNLMVALKKNDTFDVNTLLMKVLGSKGPKIVRKKDLKVKSTEEKMAKNWNVRSIFWKTGLRKSDPDKEEKFLYTERRDSRAEKYGFRGEIFMVDENETLCKDNFYLGCDVDKKFDIQCVPSKDEESKQNKTYKQIPRMFFDYKPYHCLLLYYEHLEKFSEKVKLTDRTVIPMLADFVREMYKYSENQPIKPVFRSLRRRIDNERFRLNLRRANFGKSDLTGANFANFELEGCDFSGCVVLSGNFGEASMNRAIFEGAYLFDCILDRAKAQGSFWSKAKLYHCQVFETDFRGTEFEPGCKSWTGTDLDTKKEQRKP